jgi:hypothetical protein
LAGTVEQQAMYTAYDATNLKSWLVNVFETIPAANPSATPAELKKLQEEALLEVFPSRSYLAPKLETVLAQQFALAAATFNNFMYYDGSKHGIFEERGYPWRCLGAQQQVRPPDDVRRH